MQSKATQQSDGLPENQGPSRPTGARTAYAADNILPFASGRGRTTAPPRPSEVRPAPTTSESLLQDGLHTVGPVRAPTPWQVQAWKPPAASEPLNEQSQPIGSVTAGKRDRSTGLGDRAFADAMLRLAPQLLPADLPQIAAVMFRRNLAVGEAVFTATSSATAAWLVTAGHLRVEYADHLGQGHGVAAAEAGVMVGVEALIGLPRHGDTVVAAAEATVYELDAQRLAMLERLVPDVAQRLLQAICVGVARRYRNNSSRAGRLVAPALAASPPAQPVRATPIEFLSAVFSRVGGKR